MKKFLKSRFDVVKSKPWKMTLFVAVIAALLFTMVYTPINYWQNGSALERGVMSIRGNSMEPTVLDGDVLYVQPVKFERGEIVAANAENTSGYENAAKMLLLKRIIGLPGETVEITKEGVKINGVLLDESAYTADQDKTLVNTNVSKYQEVVLSDNEYYVIGDHREESFDSRHVGAISARYFKYGLTLEPNDYTRQLIGKAIGFFAICILCLLAVPTLTLVALGFEPKKPKPKTKKSLANKSPAPKPVATKVEKRVETTKPTMAEKDVARKLNMDVEEVRKQNATKKKSANKAKTSKNRRKMANKTRSQNRKK